MEPIDWAGKLNDDLLEHARWEMMHLATLRRTLDTDHPFTASMLATQEMVAAGAVAEVRRRGLKEPVVDGVEL